MKVRRSARENALACLIGVVVFAYFLAFPLQLSQSDEGVYLYDSQRVLQGQVLYRDFFEFITPGSMYFFAGVFAVMGSSLRAARIAAAAVNGLSAVLLFSLTRRVAGVVEAVAAALVFGVVCLSVWRQASPHWISTCLCLATAAAVLSERSSSGMRAAAAGAFAGLTVCVHQHHGVFIGMWLLVAFAALAQLAPPGERWRAWWRQTAWAACVGGAIVLAVLGYCAWNASVARLVYALYTFVFESYAPRHSTGIGAVAWGGWFWMSAGDLAYTWPWLLRWLPVALGCEALSLLWRLRRVRGRDEVLRGCLLLLAVAMAVSILYYPDYIHVSFIAPFLLIVAARVVYVLLARIPGARSVLFAVLVLALAIKGSQNLVRMRADAPARVDGPFGTLDLSVGQHALLDGVREVAGPGRHVLFSYPADAWLYLAVPADNPTPYSLLLPRYNTPQQYADAIAAVERRKTDYLVLLTGLLPDDDVFLGYARERYEVAATRGPYTIYRRAS